VSFALSVTGPPVFRVQVPREVEFARRTSAAAGLRAASLHVSRARPASQTLWKSIAAACERALERYTRNPSHAHPGGQRVLGESQRRLPGPRFQIYLDLLAPEQVQTRQLCK